MAGLGKKTFVNGAGLPASELNGYLMDQSVMRFASAAARNTAIPSPTEGMVCYLDDVNWLMVYTGSAWTFSSGDRPNFWSLAIGQSITSSSYNVINGGTQVNRGSFTNTSGTITLPLTGIYTISYSIEFPANATGQRLGRLSLNGSQYAMTSSILNSTANGTQLSSSITFSMNAGNTVSAQAWQNSGANMTVNGVLTITYLGA